MSDLSSLGLRSLRSCPPSFPVPSVGTGLLSRPGSVLGALVSSPIHEAAKSSRTPRDSKCPGLRGGLALSLSGCVNEGVCLSFLIWKSGNNSIYM